MGRLLTHSPCVYRRFPKCFQLLAAALFVLAFGSPTPASADEARIEALVFESGRMDFSVDTGRAIARYSVNPLFVLPGEEVPFRSRVKAGSRLRPRQAPSRKRVRAPGTGARRKPEASTDWRFAAAAMPSPFASTPS